MDRVIAELSDPNFWNKPHTGGGVGLIVGGAVGFFLSFYFLPSKMKFKNLFHERRVRVLIAVPCMLIGMLIGILIGQLIGLQLDR